jgi:hypothetical protein
MITPTLTVEHIITSDDPWGAPWPPDGTVSIVRRVDGGWTLWRRIRLSETRAYAPPPAARGTDGGTAKDK